MSKPAYISLEINDLQRQIMQIVIVWVRKEKTPVPQMEIIKQMAEIHDTGENATVYGIKALMRKRYIRTAIGTSNRSSYVALRSI